MLLLSFAVGLLALQLHLTPVLVLSFSATQIQPLQLPLSLSSSLLSSSASTSSELYFSHANANTNTNTNTNTNHNIQISTVKTKRDIISLADLRYNEWMRASSDGDGDGDTNVNVNVNVRAPQLSSFRLATAEIFHERNVDASIVFLATLVVDGYEYGGRYSNGKNSDGKLVVGAAELSPIELQGVFVNNYDADADADAASSPPNNQKQRQQQRQQQQQLINKIAMPLYITDVVTSSTHRRHGIGTKLMLSIETAAWAIESRVVFLHVEHDNVGAREFYTGLGYINVHINMEYDDDDDDDDDDVANTGNGIIHFLLEEDSKLLTRVPSSQAAAQDKPDNSIIAMDTSRLAVNAGTVGQLLMMKQLLVEPPKIEEHDVQNQITITNATPRKQPIIKGFGSAKVVKKQKRRKRR